MEPLKDPRKFCRRNTRAVVFHFNASFLPIRSHSKLHTLAGRAEADGILQQVAPDQFEVVGVSAQRYSAVAGEIDRDITLVRQRRQALDCALAGRRRLRPIVMTAMAAVAGMLPLALALGTGSQMPRPLAIAVIGGILLSMVLSLIITPAVHVYLSHSPNHAEAK